MSELNNGAVELLTPGEVARLFGVDPKTVTRWAAAGKLQALRTLGGHRRYRAAEVHGLLQAQQGRVEEQPIVVGRSTLLAVGGSGATRQTG